MPYTIEPTFRAEALRKATAWASGQIRIPGVGAAPSASGEASKSTNSGGSMSPRTMAIAGGVGVVVLGVILYMVFGGSKPANNQGPGPTPGATGPKSPDAPSAASATPPKTSTPAPKGPAETPKAPVTQATKPPVVPGPTPIPAEGDPRTGWGLDARLEVVGQLVDRLDRERVAGGLKPLDYGFQPRLNRAKERAEKFVKTRPYSAGQRDAIVGDMSSIDAEVQGVAQEAAAELTKVLAGVDSFLKNEAKQPQTATGVMKQAWERGMGAIDPQLGWEHARARHAALAKDLKDAEVAVMGASQLALPALADVNPPALQGAADARRDAALQSAADAVLAGDGAKVKDAASVYASWGNLAKGLLDQARTLDQMMAEGQVVGDPGAAGYGALADQMEQSPAWRDLGAPLASLTARAKALEAMRGEKDPAALLNTLSSARSDMAKNRLAEAMNAWAALGAMGQWPGDDAGMTKAQQAWTNDVKPVIARAPEARHAALTARAQRAADAMWLSFAARRAVDAKGVAAASDAAAAMGVAPATVQQAPEWVRYNLARGALEKAATAAEPLAPAAKGEALRQAMSAFVASTSGLGVAKQGPGAALGAALAPLMDKGGELDLSKLGPGAVGWTMAGAAEDHVTYELTGPGGTSRVEFRRTEGGGEGVSFISTTEMSVGAFIDIITTSGRGEDLRSWLPKSDAGGVDPRQGPRTWVWSGSALAIVKTAGPGDLGKGWVRIKTAMAQREYYPAGVNVEAPGRDHPMQYVSPQAAILAARLAGCRLPSSGEWKAAGGGPSAPGANLRDATWKKVHEHLRQFAASGPEFPGSGIFWPTGVTRRSPLDDAQPATEADDGQVWFVPVTAGEGTFKNLVGNVSEYVFEEPSQLDGLATTREAIEQVLGKGEKLRIIGASALSPADEKPDNAYPVTTTQSREGYSDVGFRLAFSAPRSAAAAGTAQRLKAALDGSGYLPGAK